MEGELSTPKMAVSLRPQLRRNRLLTATVTPTMALSEGPLTPSPNFTKCPHQETDMDNGSPSTAELESIRAQMRQLTDIVQSKMRVDEGDVGESCARLGEENRQLRQSLLDAEERLQSYGGQVVDFEAQYREEVDNWRRKVDELSAKLAAELQTKRDLQKEFGRMRKAKSSLEAYLAKLPSNEEHETLKREAREGREAAARLGTRLENSAQELEAKSREELRLRSELRSCQQKAEELGLRLYEAEKANRGHEKRLDEASSGTSDVESALACRDRLRDENAKLKRYILHADRRSKAAADGLARDLDESALERSRLRAELERAAAARDEELATNRLLRDQVGASMFEVKQLKAKNEALAKAVDELSDSEPYGRLQAALVRESAECVGRLKALASVSWQLMDGQDPNVSCLLGLNAIASPEAAGGGGGEPPAAATSADRAEHARKLLSTLRAVRQTTEEMRERLSDRYADSLADDAANMCISQ